MFATLTTRMPPLVLAAALLAAGCGGAVDMKGTVIVR
jgi:hypothetical protein